MAHVRRISNSEIQTYKRCRRKWYLGYFRQKTPAVRRASGPLALGIRVHDALQVHYDEHDSRDPVAVLNSHVEDDVRAFPEQEDSIRKDADLARAMIEGYLEWVETEGADAYLEIIAPEEAVEIALGKIEGDDTVLMGKLDVRVRNLISGARQWLDHKTVGNLTDLPKTAYMDEQFRTYSLLELLKVRQTGEGGEWADGGIINMLRKVKRTGRSTPPFYGREEVRYNIDVMREFWGRVHAEIVDIAKLDNALRDGGDHHALAYPTPNWTCSWGCDFYPVCPMFDENDDVAEEFLADHYVDHDPYERYDLHEETR